MWHLVFRNLMYKKTRSLLTITGILAAIQLYAVMSGLMSSFDSEIQKQVAAMAGRVVVEYKSESISFPPMDTVLEEKTAGDILEQPGIDSASSGTLLFQTLIPAPGPNMPPSLMAVGIEPGKENSFLGNADIQGMHRLEDDHSAILGSEAAVHYGVTIGDNITLRNETFLVTGIVEKAGWLINGSVLIPQHTAQDIFGRQGMISALILTAERANEVQAIAERIMMAYPKLRASTSEDLAVNAESLIQSQRTFFTMINSTAIVIAAVVVTIVMVMSIFERRKEIGTLKAIGASRRKIIGIIIAESLTLCLLGGIIALPVSIVLNGFMFEQWTMDPVKWLETVLVSILVGLLAALWPAWTANRVNPLESLRYE